MEKMRPEDANIVVVGCPFSRYHFHKFPPDHIHKEEFRYTQSLSPSFSDMYIQEQPNTSQGLHLLPLP
jgi:hypothetical protein